MFDSPLSASAYEILEVDPSVDDAELRRAYRLRMRQTHPDTGGDAAVFIQVQRAWELIGTPEGRAAYDRRTGVSEAGSGSEWSGWRPSSAARTDTRPRARSYGQPGGWRRERYLVLIREWVGRGVEVPDPYDPALVRAAPRELRRMLADALAEEHTARTVSALGMGFTVWHDVAAGADADDKLDHVVLSPSGLYGVMSEDFGGVVGFRRGEITGPSLGTRAPVTGALARMRTVAKAAKVKFGGAIMVLPDDDLAQAVTSLGTSRGMPVVVVRRSALAMVLRQGVPGAREIGGNELFDVRTRLQQTVRFV
ncbi:J domain-containing protein [Microbacterium oxydans]|uniref:Chaperone protein DnaJ n=1 Tax=Microbacterium oxydans TaxID=82380 RepID=A0A0F0LDB9_9MICO|nr:J domain-containing protein [Microbacterium oxydans]KJL30265.1 Chaperone protein DnaJ [Microbacterium oxydans]